MGDEIDTQLFFIPMDRLNIDDSLFILYVLYTGIWDEIRYGKGEFLAVVLVQFFLILEYVVTVVIDQPIIIMLVDTVDQEMDNSIWEFLDPI